MTGVHNPPGWLSAKQRLLVAEAYMRALYDLGRARAPRAYVALFTEIFEQRCGLKERVPENRAYLRQLMGVSSDRTVTRGLTWLWRNKFLWRAGDGSRRKLGTLMIEKRYLPWGSDFWADKPRPAPAARTQVSHSTLSRTPQLPLAASEKLPYSAERRQTKISARQNGQTATTSPGRRTTKGDGRPAVSSARELVAGLLGKLGPPG